MNVYAHLVYVLLIVGALIGGVLYERHEGAQGCEARGAQAAEQQQVHNAGLDAHASDVNQSIGEDLHAEQSAAPAADAPHVLVCPPAKAARPRPVLPAAPASAGADAAPAVPAAPARDIGPPIDTAGRDADAQVKGLQRYITEVCLAR